MNSRAKGARGEREIVKAYKGAGFVTARTSNGLAQSGRGDIKGVPGLHIEVKRTEKLNIWLALAQAERDRNPGEMPAVHFKRNRSDWFVAITLDDFLDLLEGKTKVQERMFERRLLNDQGQAA